MCFGVDQNRIAEIYDLYAYPRYCSVVKVESDHTDLRSGRSVELVRHGTRRPGFKGVDGEIAHKRLSLHVHNMGANRAIAVINAMVNPANWPADRVIDVAEQDLAKTVGVLGQGLTAVVSPRLVWPRSANFLGIPTIVEEATAARYGRIDFKLSPSTVVLVSTNHEKPTLELRVSETTVDLVDEDTVQLVDTFGAAVANPETGYLLRIV